MTHQLCEPILDDGLRNTNFFNGRLLAAEDLHAQQVAEQQHHGQLGRAIGSGVVRGLEVRMAQPDGSATGVTIAPGLAINANGQPLELPVAVDLALVVTPATVTQAGQFADCSTVSPLLATGVGAYALLMSPASGFLQNAPMSGLGANGALTGCGARYQVEGVTFRLVRLDLASLPGLSATTRADLSTLMDRTNLISVATAPPTDAADLSMLRNRLAHACFGTELIASLPRDPLAVLTGQHSAFDSYGALDALRAAGGLTDDDVALALVYWTQVGIRFVDMWSVRRKPVPPGYAQPWELLVGPRRQREAEASLMQFQQHLAWLSTDLRALPLVVAQRWFRYLPPVGMLPLRPTTLSTAVNPTTWFEGLTFRDPATDPEYMEGASLRALLHQSLDYPAIDLLQPEMIRVYRVRENQQANDAGGQGAPGAYVVFANAHMPVFSLARFNANYWNYANYA